MSCRRFILFRKDNQLRELGTGLRGRRERSVAGLWGNGQRRKDLGTREGVEGAQGLHRGVVEAPT